LAANTHRQTLYEESIMHLIDGAGHVNNNFVAEDVASHRPPTEITAEFMNAIQHELANFINWAGYSLEKQVNTQLRDALISSFAHKNSTIHYIRQVWTIVADIDALLALENVPTNAEVIVTNYNGAHGISAWSGSTWTTTALAVNVFDLYGTDVDQHGYYWFSNQWNLFDVAALQVDDATEIASGIARIASAEEAIAGLATNLIITPATLAVFSRLLLPAGTEIFWTGTTSPVGFIEENGAILSRAAYPALWAHAQASGNIVTDAEWSNNSWGAFSTGDGSTTFRLPDARGEFIRAWDNGRGIDAGREITARQEDALQGHRHAPPPGKNNFVSAPGSWNGSGGSNATYSGASTGDPVTDGVNGTPRVASETRPRNLARMICIKY
jgi:hypothetical protein